jgi:hypothetical protein
VHRIRLDGRFPAQSPIVQQRHAHAQCLQSRTILRHALSVNAVA